MSHTIKKSLRSTIFTSVLSAAIIAPAANAYTINSDLIELSPVTPWSVSQAGTNSAQAYCTLSKTFKKNIILTLAENVDQNLTFALDFQKDRFEPRSEYNVILATDNGDSRSYELSPATGKAFIIRVKDDAEFYNNLWQSNSLIVSVNTENYRFNTADFLSGKQNLTPCLTQLQSLKPAPQNEPEISSLKPQINNVPVVTTAKIETQNAASIAEASPAEALSMAPKVQQVGFKTERLGEISKIAGDVEVLKQENMNLKAALKKERALYESKLSAVYSNDKETQELTQKISLLSSENSSLRSQIKNQAKAQTNAAIGTNQKLASEIERLKTENNLLKTSLNAAESARESQSLETVSLNDYEDLQGKNNILSAQIRSLTTENYKLKNLASVTSKSGQAQKGNIKTLSTENALLKQEIETKNERISRLQGSLQLANTKVEDYSALKQQIAEMKTQNSQLAQSYAKLETASGQATPANADAELMSLQQRYQEQQLEIERMAKQMEQERQSFKIEQKRLESMLFDPAVTEQRQLSHLAKLEEELRLSNQALAEQRAMYEGGNANAINSSSSIMSGTERVSLMEMSKEIQKLRDEIDRLRRAPVAKSPVPRIQKAEITEKRVVLTKDTTLETAEPVIVMERELVADTVNMEGKEKNLLPPVDMIKAEDEPVSSSAKIAANTNIQAPEPEIEVVIEEQPEEIAMVKENAHPKKLPTLKSHAYQGNKPFIALPDQFMLDTIAKQDSKFAVKGKQNGTVLWQSENVEGSVVRKHLQGQDFTTSVDQMLGNLKQKCPAVLDVEPLLLRKGKAGNLFAYDADCGSTTIGLIFFSKDGQTLSTVSYGATKDNKPALDSKREKLIEALMGTMKS